MESRLPECPEIETANLRNERATKQEALISTQILKSLADPGTACFKETRKSPVGQALQGFQLLCTAAEAVRG